MAQLGTVYQMQPSEVRVRRTECIKAIKVFEESEKKIRMDPDISKLIRTTEKESKYVKGMLLSIKSLA